MPATARTGFQPSWAAQFPSLCLVCLLATVSTAQTNSTPTDDEINWAKEQQFWSFRRPIPQKPPTVKNQSWPAQPLDYFILARLEKKSLAPALEADKRTLIRRATFDITGLPPTPENVERFLKDKRGDAYERLVDRLLGSPQFGERMASLWLPLVRYAEDQAHQVGSDTQYAYPNAFKYREWVVNAFNRDLRYDNFIRFQLAADKIKDAGPENLAALGFVGLGPKYYNRDRLEVKADEWEDRVDTVSRTFLGLTVACARCHDHKFDPITMADYYGLAGVFASTKLVNRSGSTNVEGKVLAEKMPADTLHMVEDGEAKDLNIFIRGNVERKGPVAERRFLRVLSKSDPVPFKEGSGRRELAEAIGSPANPLTARVMVNRVWGWLFGAPLVSTPSNFGHSGQQPTYPELLDDLALRFIKNGWSMKTLVREIVLSSTYRQTSSSPLKRAGSTFSGNSHSRPNQSAVLPLPEGEGRGEGEGRQKELLDVPNRQEAAGTVESASADPTNELLSRMNRRRLSIEQWRDAVLFMSGELEAIGGKSLELDDPKNRHRTLYARVSRLKLNDLLMQFDYPDANVHAEKRSVTTTPMQKLFLLNSPFMVERAKSLSKRIAGEATRSNPARVERAYQMVFGREPSRAELKVALAFLGKPETGEMSRWEQYAQMLLVSNEMFYVD
jgi:hypothetical protein